MSDFTAYTETQVLDWISQGATLNPPAALYVALHTAAPGDTPDGTTEVGATEYNRVETAPTTDWDVTGNSPRTLTNAVEILFPETNSNWGTITHVSIWDGADATGNCFGHYAVGDGTTGIDITDTDRARFGAGDLDFNVD